MKGRVSKTVARGALLEQPYIRDPNKTVNDVVTAAIAKLGENIKIRRFSRSMEAPSPLATSARHIVVNMHNDVSEAV